MNLRLGVLILTLALGLLAAALPAEAEKAGKVYRVGVLRPLPGFGQWATAVIPAWLGELGYLEGENIVFERRSAIWSDGELPELAAELVRLKVDVIVTAGTPAARAAKQATTTIPIVIAAGDPVGAGLVASLARPGGNITGVTFVGEKLMGKRLEFLKEAMPGLMRVGVVWDPTNPGAAEQWQALQAPARVLGVELQSLEVSSREDFESAFDAAIRERADALLVVGGKPTGTPPRRVEELAMKSRLPVMYPNRGFVTGRWSSGLISYGPDTINLFRRAAALVDKILKGAKPADLPVEQPTNFELVINLKIATVLGLTIPDSILIRADEIVE